MKFRGLEKINVFVVSVVEGDGTENNPCWIVKYYMRQGDNGNYELLYKDDSENRKTAGREALCV